MQRASVPYIISWARRKAKHGSESPHARTNAGQPRILPSPIWTQVQFTLRCSPRRSLLDFLEEDCAASSDSRLKAFRAGFPTLQAVSFLSPRAASEWMGMCKKVSKNLAENHSPQMPFKSLPTESFIRHVTRESGAWS